MKKIDTQYGIEITKPFSKQMYEHNDKVAEEMKANIVKQWNALIHGIDMDTDWEDFGDDENTVKLQKLVCYSGYGSGYTLGMVNDEFKQELDTMANWQLHEEYSYGCFERLLPRMSYQFVAMVYDSNRKLNNKPNVFRTPDSLLYPRQKANMPTPYTLSYTLHIETKTLNDGWTAVTKDKSLSAQFEHTIGVTKDGYEIFTLSKNK